METIELKSIATIRTLSIDAIEKANSGHPGMPMGLCTNGVRFMDESLKRKSAKSKLV